LVVNLVLHFSDMTIKNIIYKAVRELLFSYSLFIILGGKCVLSVDYLFKNVKLIEN